ncbi:ribosome-inactivating family protein [Kitasatospora sp. NPDC028055]|uniref:ribosome-inactivating family protein n=1 Tax=Kitasatospora sp. NPDC028055 TaxID=3155653 RepID=UPI0033D17A3A
MNPLLVFVIAVLTVAATAVGAQPARADIGPGYWRYLHTKIIVDSSSDISGRREYTQIVTLIRQAAGHPFDGDIREIQEHAGGLIVLELEGDRNEHRGTLLINPHSLYIVGFGSAHNYYYYFRDAAPSAIQEIRNLAVSQHGHAVELPMTGAWNEWEQRIAEAGVGLQRNYNAADFSSASWQLWRFPPGPVRNADIPNIAESMRTLSAAYELGVRWTSFRNDVTETMGRTTYQTRVPVYDQRAFEIRRAWERWVNWADRYAVWWRNHRNAEASTRLPESIDIGPVNGTLNTLGDLHREVQMTVYLKGAR